VNGEGSTLLDAWFAAARWGWYVALFLVLGAGTYAPSLFGARTALDAAEPALARRISMRAARAGLFAALALTLLTFLRLRLQLQTFLDPGEPLTRDLVTATLGTAWGKGWLGQAALALLAIPAFAWARTGSRGGWMLAHAAGGGLGLVAGATGHAVSNVGGRYGFLLDAAHVWAGGLWLGGLALLLASALPTTRALEPGAKRQVIRALVADFSRRALIVAPAAVVLGGWLAVSYLGWRWPLELTQSSYGRMLGLKLLALVGVGLLGAWNWRVVQPGLARGGDARRVVRSGATELLFGALLLAATAVLVATALPGEEM
jgi:putative copper resistance protein D